MTELQNFLLAEHKRKRKVIGAAFGEEVFDHFDPSSSDVMKDAQKYVSFKVKELFAAPQDLNVKPAPPNNREVLKLLEKDYESNFSAIKNVPIETHLLNEDHPKF